MRITKQGEIPADYTGTWKCAICGCEWIMEASDPEPSGGSEANCKVYKMPCAHCGATTYRSCFPKHPLATIARQNAAAAMARSNELHPVPVGEASQYGIRPDRNEIEDAPRLNKNRYRSAPSVGNVFSDEEIAARLKSPQDAARRGVTIFLKRLGA